MTPYEAWYGKVPDLSNLRTFGCVAFSHIPDSQRRKLDNKTQKVRFLGYPPGGHGYRVMEEKTLRVALRVDVLFDETRFNLHSAQLPSMVTHRSGDDMVEFTKANESVGDELTPNVHPPIAVASPKAVPAKPTQAEAEPEAESVRGKRSRNPTKRYGVDEGYLSEINFVHSAFSAEVTTEPTSMKEALESEDRQKWQAAAQAEYDSLQEHDT